MAQIEGLQLRLREVSQESMNYASRLAKLESSSSMAINEAETIRFKLVNNLNDVESESTCQKVQLENAISERDELRKLLEQAEQRASVPQRAEGDEESDRVLREELRRQAKNLSSFAAANARLTSDNNVLRAKANKADILREEKRTLTSKLEAMDVLRVRVAELEADKVDFRRREKDWMSLLRLPGVSGIDESFSEHDGPQVALAKLQDHCKELSTKSISLKADLDKKESELEALRIASGESEDAAGIAEALKEEAEADAKRWQFRSTLLEKENAMLKKHLVCGRAFDRKLG